MEKVTKGHRNNVLMGIAIKQVLQGVTCEELRNFLYQYNEEWCDPPLEKWEIKAIVGDVLDCEFKKPDFLSYTYTEDERVKSFLKTANKYKIWAKDGDKIDYIDIESLVNMAMVTIFNYEKRLKEIK